MGMEKEGLSRINLILILSVFVIVIGLGVLIFVFVAPGFGEIPPEEQQPDSVSVQCAFLCESGQKSGFCDVQRTLNDGTKDTCNNLANENMFNVQTCNTISCTETVDQSCSGLGGTWETPENGECPSQEDMFVRKRNPSDQPPEEGQICCYYYE